MKKITIAFSMLLITLISFAQTEKTNGTIYIKHPFIDVVNNATAAYVKGDVTSWKTFYADTAKFSISGIEKVMNLQENAAALGLDHKFFTNISIKTVGYPDYLHYDEQDSKVVQSWWRWTGTSKKTGKVLKISFVNFDWFNNEGKIVREIILGDFSKQFAEEGMN
jgi:hypothetical protein